MGNLCAFPCGGGLRASPRNEAARKVVFLYHTPRASGGELEEQHDPCCAICYADVAAGMEVFKVSCMDRCGDQVLCAPCWLQHASTKASTSIICQSPAAAVRTTLRGGPVLLSARGVGGILARAKDGDGGLFAGGAVHRRLGV